MPIIRLAGMRRSFYLDTTAWINLLRPTGQFDAVIEAHNQEKIFLCFSQENLNELIQNDEISIKNKERDLPRLSNLVENFTPDEIAILNHGKLDNMKFASELDQMIFRDHLSSARKKNRNSIADGVHLLNAMNCGAILVTKDKEQWESSIRCGLRVIWFPDFLSTPEIEWP